MRDLQVPQNISSIAKSLLTFTTFKVFPNSKQTGSKVGFDLRSVTIMQRRCHLTAVIDGSESELDDINQIIMRSLQQHGARVNIGLRLRRFVFSCYQIQYVGSTSCNHIRLINSKIFICSDSGLC